MSKAIIILFQMYVYKKPFRGGARCEYCGSALQAERIDHPFIHSSIHSSILTSIIYSLEFKGDEHSRDILGSSSGHSKVVKKADFSLTLHTARTWLHHLMWSPL